MAMTSFLNSSKTCWREGRVREGRVAAAGGRVAGGRVAVGREASGQSGAAAQLPRATHVGSDELGREDEREERLGQAPGAADFAKDDDVEDQLHQRLKQLRLRGEVAPQRSHRGRILLDITDVVRGEKVERVGRLARDLGLQRVERRRQRLHDLQQRRRVQLDEDVHVAAKGVGEEGQPGQAELGV